MSDEATRSLLAAFESGKGDPTDGGDASVCQSDSSGEDTTLPMTFNPAKRMGEVFAFLRGEVGEKSLELRAPL